MKKVSASLFVLFFIFLFTAGMPVASLGPVPATVETITPGELRMHLEFLASDELGGRYTLAPNFAIAARYLAAHLEAYGFHGAGDHGEFLLTASPSAGEAQGQIVFVGAGISSPAQKHDDYAGLDVKGKIVLIAPGTPSGIDSSRLSTSEQGQGAARAHGAVGILQLPPQRFLEAMKDKSFLERFASRETVRLAKEADGGLPGLVLGPDAAEKVLAAGALNLKAIY